MGKCKERLEQIMANRELQEQIRESGKESVSNKDRYEALQKQRNKD